MAVAEAVSTARLQRRVGATMQVLVDHASALGRKGARARSYADAPEIDGTVIVEGGSELAPGSFAEVTVTAAREHDLVASLARSRAKPALG